MNNLIERMIRAARLEPALYEEVEADQEALGQAAAVVVMSSAAAGIGSAAIGGSTGLVTGAIAALVGWAIWAAVIYVVGTKLLPEPQTSSDVAELMRTLGFAASPGVLRILGVIAPLAGLIMLVTWLWMLAATVVAVRQALDYQSTARAVGVCIVAFVAETILVGLLIAPIAIGF